MNGKVLAKLYYYDEDDLIMALDGYKWMSAMHDLDNWLRNKVKHESGLENKSGEELEHYVDAYCSAREELHDILMNHGISIT